MNRAGKKLKSLLRKEFLNRRQSLTRDEVLEKSSSILKQLSGLKSFRDAGTVHCYISMNERNEVFTEEIIEMCFSLNKKVVVPKMVRESRLEHYYIEQGETLLPNAWGVPEPEPVPDKKAGLTDIDLILIPMVAADREKNRLGYGKGFYDRFLSKCDAVKTGLLFDVQLSDKALPVEEHDVKLDLLITESGVIL
jgi:5-formyltetrahydrofolate cyclo-ligase